MSSEKRVRCRAGAGLGLGKDYSRGISEIDKNKHLVEREEA